jgi:hypothetical protein
MSFYSITFKDEEIVSKPSLNCITINMEIVVIGSYGSYFVIPNNLGFCGFEFDTLTDCVLEGQYNFSCDETEIAIIFEFLSDSILGGENSNFSSCPG